MQGGFFINFFPQWDVEHMVEINLPAEAPRKSQHTGVHWCPVAKSGKDGRYIIAS